MVFLGNIRKALGDGEDFWLKLSILLYVAVLPFNAFAIHILPGPYFRLNITKVALALVVILGLRSYFKGRSEIKKAYLLYSFLILQIFWTDKRSSSSHSCFLGSF